MHKFLIMTTAALGLGLSACGIQSTQLSRSSSKMDSSAIPHFQTTGQSFYISTGCSPHSLQIDLHVNETNLELRNSTDYGWSDTYTLNFATNSLTVVTSVYSPSPSNAEPRITKTLFEPSDPSYGKTYAELLKGVQSLRDGNQSCFPARPELEEVLIYLRKA